MVALPYMGRMRRAGWREAKPERGKRLVARLMSPLRKGFNGIFPGLLKCLKLVYKSFPTLRVILY
jgi:hypothetical protein